MATLADIIQKRIEDGNYNRHPVFRSGDELFLSALEYIEFTDANPVLSVKPMQAGGIIEMIEVPLKRPYTIHALALYLGVSRRIWYAWRDPSNADYRPDLVGAIRDIEDIFYNDQVVGATTNIYNANIVSRLLSLVDRTEVTTIAEDVDIDDSMTFKEKMKAYKDNLKNSKDGE